MFVLDKNIVIAVDNHLFVISFTTGSETGLAVVTAPTERRAIDVLKHSGRYNGYPEAYKILESRNMGLTTCLRTELFLESYVNSAVVFDALSRIAPKEGPRGPEGPDGPSAYEVAVKNGFVGSETDWLISLKASITAGDITRILGYAPVSPAQLDGKVDKIGGMGLSQCNYTTSDSDTVNRAQRYFQNPPSQVPEPRPGDISEQDRWIDIPFDPTASSIPLDPPGFPVKIEYNTIGFIPQDTGWFIEWTETDEHGLIIYGASSLGSYIYEQDFHPGAVLHKSGPALEISRISYSVGPGDYHYINGEWRPVPVELGDLSQDTYHKVVTDAQIASWNAKYTKPNTGIPASDLAESVLSSVYKASGTVSSVSNLGSLTASNLGKVYNLSASFTTTSDFVEGSGKTYPAGTNVAIVDVGSGSSHSYKYDVLAGLVDISGKADKVSGATSGNFAGLDSNGNLTDSGYKHSDYSLAPLIVDNETTTIEEIAEAAAVNRPMYLGIGNQETSIGFIPYIGHNTEHGYVFSLVDFESLGQIVYYCSDEGEWSVQVFPLPSSLSDLGDVDDTTPTDGQALIWDDTNSTWKPGAAGSPDAVKYVSQSLTSEQQAQARTNIGAGTYSKPNNGIPSTDMSSAVQTSLGKADTALQSFTETDPTVPSWAKAQNPPTEIFWATYGTTTASEIDAAEAAGKAIACLYNDKMFFLAVKTDNDYVFTAVQGGIVYGLLLKRSNSAWSTQNNYLENSSNRQNAIPASPDNYHYPSSKAVADFGALATLFGDFDHLVPVQTIEYDVTNGWKTLLTRANSSGTVGSSVKDVIAARITVTGTGMDEPQVIDFVLMLSSRAAVPFVGIVLPKTPDVSAASKYGLYQIRGCYPRAIANGYPWQIDISVGASNITRHLKVEVFKTSSNVAFSTNEVASGYNSTYQDNIGGLGLDQIRLFFNPSVSINGTSTSAAYLHSFLPSFVAQQPIKAGEAVSNGNLLFISTDGKAYLASNTSKPILADDSIHLVGASVAADSTIGYAQLKQNGGVAFASTGTTYGTFATGDEIYLRCSFTNGQIYSDGVLTNIVSAGHTWISIGKAVGAGTLALSTVGKPFFTLDSNGKLTHINGREIAGGGGTVTDVTVGGTSVVNQQGVAEVPAIPYDTEPVGEVTLATVATTGNYTDLVFPNVGTSQPSGGMLPNVLYDLGTLTGTVTISLASAVSGIENEYKFKFDTDSTAPTITFPNSVTSWVGNCLDNGAPLIAASKHYEVSIEGEYGVIAEF